MQTSSSAPLCLNHPDITAMADWACKTNYQFVCQSVFYLYGWMYLSICFSVCLLHVHLSIHSFISLSIVVPLLGKGSHQKNVRAPLIYSRPPSTLLSSFSRLQAISSVRLWQQHVITQTFGCCRFRHHVTENVSLSTCTFTQSVCREFVPGTRNAQQSECRERPAK